MNDTWVIRIGSVSGTPCRIRLVCIAHAGGSPDLFRHWRAGLSPDVELLVLQLPGHGRRIKERPYQDWKSLTADAFDALSAFLSVPHAFYGHSFGGRLAYELVRRATERFPGLTEWLFVSGCRTPASRQSRPLLHLLPDREFVAALRDMGGTPAEVLASPTLMELVLPTVRAEIRLAELWGDPHAPRVTPPVTALCGRDDRVEPRAAMRGWPSFGGAEGELIEILGGHFFVETHREQVLAVINSRIRGGNGEN